MEILDFFTGVTGLICIISEMEVALKPRNSLAQKLLSEFHYVTSLAYHTLSSPLSLSTLHQTITIERPNYPPSHTFLLNLMKTVLSYEHHNLTRSNFFMSFFERWIVNPLVPYWRLEIRHFELSVDSRVLNRDVVEGRIFTFRFLILSFMF